jgi:hypothetical protein
VSATEAAERAVDGLGQQYTARVFLVDADRYPGVVDVLIASLQQSPLLSPARLLVLIGQADTVTGLPIDGQRIERLSKPLDHRVALQRIRRLLET